MIYNNPELPYNDLPLLPPTQGLDKFRLSEPLLEARVALARLAEASKHSQFVGPLAWVIPLVEAQASAAIENIVTTQDELFSVTVDKAITGDEAMNAVLRYHKVMGVGRDYLKDRPITPELSKLICSAISGVDESFRNRPGTRIGANAPVYTPPDNYERISELLDNWATFINNSSELDPLIKMALAHYQFEAIHPFRDGNGRTGRILNLLQLQSDGLLKHPVLHLSRVIKDDLFNYYRLLQMATEQRDYTEWVAYMLEKVRTASEIALFQLEELGAYSIELAEKKSTIFKSGVPTNLMGLVVEFPYCTIAKVIERCNVSRPTATKWLEQLESDGFLVSTVKGRNKYFVNERVLKILNP